MGDTYYSGNDYNIYKRDEWFLIIPTESVNNLKFVDIIADKTIFDLRKMAKKDILDYFNEINKTVRNINNKVGLHNLKEIDTKELMEAEKNNDSKKFDKILSDSLEQVKNIQKGLKECNNKGKTIDKMFDIVLLHVSDPDFLKWLKLNLNLCVSCESFSQVENIYKEQKALVEKTMQNENNDAKEVKLNEVSSMQNVEIKNIPQNSEISPKNESNMTLEETGLKPVGLESTNDTFVMDSTPTYDNNTTTIVQNSQKVRRLVPPKPNTNDLDNAAFTNWYGIILTLIFSFAIGYFIAWIILKMR